MLNRKEAILEVLEDNGELCNDEIRVRIGHYDVNRDLYLLNKRGLVNRVGIGRYVITDKGKEELEYAKRQEVI